MLKKIIAVVLAVAAITALCAFFMRGGETE